MLPYDSPDQAVLAASSPSIPAGRLFSSSHGHGHIRAPSICFDREGWGPQSPIRFDLTPCFLDSLIFLLGVSSILGTTGALIYLLRKKSALPVPKNWHFYAKLVRQAASSECHSHD